MSEERVEWETLPNGDIATRPVAGWGLGAFPMNVLLRLDVVQEDGSTEVVQVHLPASGIADFAKALVQKAERAMDESAWPKG